jgi:RNA recognition motif-containing protein
LTKIYVRNLEAGATRESVRSLFETYGNVERVRMSAHPKAARPGAFAFVEMPDAAASHAIKALHGSTRGNDSLHVVRARAARPASKEAAD